MSNLAFHELAISILQRGPIAQLDPLLPSSYLPSRRTCNVRVVIFVDDSTFFRERPEQQTAEDSTVGLSDFISNAPCKKQTLVGTEL